MVLTNKIATVGTQKTAWRLVEALATAGVPNECVVVLRGPDGPCEVHPLCGFHPDDKELAKKVVAGLRQQILAEADEI